MNDKAVSLLFDKLQERIENAVEDDDQKKIILKEIENLKSQTNDTTLVLDQISMGIAIAAKDASVNFINQYGREVLETCDGLSLVDGVLTCHQPATTERFRQEIALSIAEPDGKARPFSIPRPSGAQPFMCLIISAGTESAAVFFSDSQRRTVTRHSIIAELYGLTQPEAIIAAAVAQGKRVTDIAKELGISVSAVRGHLRQVYAKSGTTRQLDLANQIGNLLASIRLEEQSDTANVVRLPEKRRQRGRKGSTVLGKS